MPKKPSPRITDTTVSGSSTLSPVNLAALRRCRPILVKDLDVTELIRCMPPDNASDGWISPEIRSSSSLNAERRAVNLLDALESSTAGSGNGGGSDADANFSAFVEALRVGERNRKLYALMNETMRALRERNDDELFSDRTSMSGSSLHQILRRRRRSSINQSLAGQDSNVNDADDVLQSEPILSSSLDDVSNDNCVDCFTVLTRGPRLQPERWIKHAKADAAALSISHAHPVKSLHAEFDNTVVLTKDLIFCRVDRSSLPADDVVKIPTAAFSSVFVVDDSYRKSSSSEDILNMTPVNAAAVAESGDVSTLNQSTCSVLETQSAIVSTPSTPMIDPPRPPRQPLPLTKTSSLNAVKTSSGEFVVETRPEVAGDVARSACDLSTPAPAADVVPPPPLPRKPLEPGSSGGESLERIAGLHGSSKGLRPLPAAATAETANDAQQRAPPLPERGLPKVIAGEVVVDEQVDKSADTSSDRRAKGVRDMPSSPPLPVRRGHTPAVASSALHVVSKVKQIDHQVAVDTESSAESLADTSSPPLLPPRPGRTNVLKPPGHQTKGEREASADRKLTTASDQVAVDNNDAVQNPEVDFSIDTVPVQRSYSFDKAKIAGSGRSPLTTRYSAEISMEPNSSSQKRDNVSLSLDTVDGCCTNYKDILNRPISQREDSGIVIIPSVDSPTAVETDVPCSAQLLPVIQTLSEDKLTGDETATSVVADDDGDGRSVRSQHSAEMSKFKELSSNKDGATGTGCDSGVDSLQSLQGPADQGQGHRRSLNAKNNDDDAAVNDVGEVCEGEDLSEIRIPAADDEFDDADDGDRTSMGYSHYEDIEVMNDNIYLDPISSARRASSSAKRRRNDAMAMATATSATSRCDRTDGVSNMCDKSSNATPSMRRKDQFAAELEASGRKLLVAGTTLILDENEAELPKTSTRIPDGESAASDTSVDATGKSSLVQSLKNARLVYDSRCLPFYIPADCLRYRGDPSGERWFFPVPMTPLEATLFLRAENQTGCFVVYRPPTKPPQALPSSLSAGLLYYLSVCLGDGGDVVHYKIVRNPCGDLSVEGHDHSFMDVAELISYFRRNRSGLPVRLGRPLADARCRITPGVSYPFKYELNRKELFLSSRSSRSTGTGTHFGKIVLGHYRGRPVAVSEMRSGSWNQSRTLRPDMEDGSSAVLDDEFLEPAIGVVAGLQHESIVRLIGVSCVERPFYAVWEHAENGNLADRLRDGTLSPDDVESLFDVCLQAAAALAYLEAQKYVLHRDLAASSFLLMSGSSSSSFALPGQVMPNGEQIIKLTNFERAKRVSDDDYQAPLSETIAVRWAAPEVLSESRYSTKSDVWSLGILFWEVFSKADTPFSSLPSAEDVAQHVGLQSTAAIVAGLGRPSGPCPDELWAAMRSCWTRRPASRVSANELCDRLRGDRTKIYSVGEVDTWRPPSGLFKELPKAPGPVILNQRPPPLPLGRSAVAANHVGLLNGREQNGFTALATSSPNGGVRTVATPDGRPLTVEKRLSAPEKRTSGVTVQAPVPLSPQWDTSSVLSSATVVNESYARGGTLRQSIHKFLHPGKKKKKTIGLSSVAAGDD